LFDDLGLATLSEVLDPISLVKHLRGVSRAPWNGRAVEEVRMRVLKHHLGRRCTLEIGLRTEKRWHFLIGKVYRKDRSQIFQTMERIQQVGFGPQDEFSIPQPIAYLSSLRLLLQEKVEGPLADEIFKTGDEHSRAVAAERCGLWLARFHTLAPKAGQVSCAKAYLDSGSMQRCSRDMTKQGGHLPGKAARLLQRLGEASSSLSPVEMCPGHGGYRATHVILVPGRTVTFDLDTYDVTDPARDVARFLSALRSLALAQLGSIRMLDGAAEVFLDAYLAAGPPDVKKNLCFFEAASCLKRAKQSLSRSVPHGQERAEAMLDEGLRVLDGKTGR
jgi:aminoglycoside phosphotransferase (APT) family kinase protein